LAAGFARFARSFARRRGIDGLLDDRAGIAGMFFEPFAYLVAHQALERLTHFGADQLVLGLAAELGIGQLDRDDRRQAFAHVLAGEGDLFLFEHSRLVGVIVDRAGQRRAEGGHVGATVALGD